jgi:hypothetical protein
VAYIKIRRKIMKKLIFLFILFLVLFLTVSASSGKVAVLPDILKPDSAAVDNNQVKRTDSLGKPSLKYLLVSCRILN